MLQSLSNFICLFVFQKMAISNLKKIELLFNAYKFVSNRIAWTSMRMFFL